MKPCDVAFLLFGFAAQDAGISQGLGGETAHLRAYGSGLGSVLC